jgi:hypothetical protein
MSKSLILQTGTTGSMVYIASSGNVGIGTSAPSSSLDVNGTIKIGSSGSTGSYRISSSPTDNFIHQSTTVGHYSLMWNGEAGALGASAYLAGYGGIKLFTVGQPRITVNSNGDVGIGTESPSSNWSMSVDNGINIAGPSGTFDNSAYGQLQVTMNDSDIASRSHIALIRAGSSVWNFRVNTSNQLVLGDLIYLSGASVGIGTANPSNKLQVDGGFKCGSVGSAYNSIRSFTTTLSSSSGVLQATINYGVTYSNPSKLVINVTIKGADNATDTFGCSVRNIGTTSMVLNVIRLDSSSPPGIVPVAHVTIYELV